MIAPLLKCENVSEVKAYLVQACLKDPLLVDTINKYLKLVVVRSVRISDFKPSARTIEKDQVEALVNEFKRFLEGQFGEDDPDSRQMLQLE